MNGARGTCGFLASDIGICQPMLVQTGVHVGIYTEQDEAWCKVQKEKDHLGDRYNPPAKIRHLHIFDIPTTRRPM
eukprot:1161480-Pelagomonas_calceolata.AAC.27